MCLRQSNLSRGASKRAPESIARTLRVMPESETQQIIRLSSSGDAVLRDGLLHKLFENQVGRSPDTIALMCEGCALTYEELNWRASQLAKSLIRKGVGPEKLVGICVERSLEKC